MKKTALAGAALAAFTAGQLPTGSRAQIISQPCETCGVAIGAPLPEGVYFADLENYGQKDGSSAKLGVNIPLVVWSTPFSFYDTRLEVIYAAPFTHTDGTANAAVSSGVLNRVDVYSQLAGFIFAHDFGHGFGGGIIAGVRTPDNFTESGRGVAADLRGSVSYVGPAGALGPIKAVATFAYSGNFGGVNAPAPAGRFNDNIYLDYTLTKTFDKFEVGVVGYAQTDLRQVGGASYGRSVAVGGLIGYAFPKVTLQAYATREVASNGGGGAYGGYYNFGGKYETRGYLRAIIPLYVAPAAPVVAKY